MDKISKKVVYWTLLHHKEWKIYIASTFEGLCFVGSQDKSFDELLNWVTKNLPGVELIENEELLQPYLNELIDFLEGNLTSFTVNLDFQGTPFQVAVWNALCSIKYGETKSYTDIVNTIHKPKSVRAVGTAIGANPILIAVPCHRVIGKNGKLTGYRGGLDMKRNLLKLESQ